MLKPEIHKVWAFAQRRNALSANFAVGVEAFSTAEAFMEAEFYEHQRFGRDQTLCAWGIVLVLALLFAILELLSPRGSSKSDGFYVAADQPVGSTWEQSRENE